MISSSSATLDTEYLSSVICCTAANLNSSCYRLPLSKLVAIQTNVKKFVEQASVNKLSIVAASIFSDENEDIEGIRLGFASLNDKELEQAVSRLKKTLIDLYS